MTPACFVWASADIFNHAIKWEICQMITNSKQTVIKDNHRDEGLQSWPPLHRIAVDYVFADSVVLYTEATVYSCYLVTSESETTEYFG